MYVHIITDHKMLFPQFSFPDPIDLDRAGTPEASIKTSTSLIAVYLRNVCCVNVYIRPNIFHLLFNFNLHNNCLW